MIYEHQPENRYPHWLLLYPSLATLGSWNDERLIHELFEQDSDDSRTIKWLRENVGPGSRQSKRYGDRQKWFASRHVRCRIAFADESDMILFKLRFV